VFLQFIFFYLNLNTKFYFTYMKPTLHFQRFEFKYPLHKPTAERIIPDLLKHMDFDPFVLDKKEKFYIVNSLYFDNEGYACYFEKESGEKFRKKFRFRIYGDEAGEETPIFAEIKRKNNVLVIKDRAVLSKKEALDMISGRGVLGTKGRDKEVLEEFLWNKGYNCLVPKIVVRYKRKPLIAKQDENVRVTFDYDIQAKPASWFNKGNYFWKNVLPGSMILEIKYNNILPFWLHEIIQKYELERVAFSKYTNSVRALVPMVDDGVSKDVVNCLGL